MPNFEMEKLTYLLWDVFPTRLKEARRGMPGAHGIKFRRWGKDQAFDFPAGWAVTARLSRWITSS